MLPNPRSLVAALVWVLIGCGCDSAGGEAGAQAAPRVGGARSADARLVRLREAIEFGRLDLARTLMAQVEAVAGFEAPLLRARTELLAGDSVAALRALEEARRLLPDDGRVYACAAEVYANLGRFPAAERELKAGLEVAGRSADLERATGVILILQPGGSTRGLAHLERALAQDPQLPFVARPLSQAHLLEGRRCLQAGDALGAFKHARLAHEHDPAELYVKELEADALQALNDFDGALELYEEIEAAGKPTRDLRAQVHQRAGTFELVRRERERALEHYRAARELGMDDEGLGTGARLLREAAEGAIDRGIGRYREGDLAGARSEFEEALRLDVTCMEAQNHLGVVLFRLEDYGGAAGCWQAVVAAAQGGLELPEPVELNLAKALRLDGRPAEARGVLETFLEGEPAAEWASQAREILDRL